MKTITIQVPDDCEVEVVRKEEETKKPIIRTYQDLIDNNIKIQGYYISGSKIYDYDIYCANNDTVDVASSKKVAKSMLAMAMISQLMPYYGGEITKKEWNDEDITKYCLTKSENKIVKCTAFWTYNFLAFHTEEQRDEFFEYNKQLVKDYLMID